MWDTYELEERLGFGEREMLSVRCSETEKES